jgi:lipopolysaccharide/colanic/teichoic acid biosynthesis glycosyltransferase
MPTTNTITTVAQNLAANKPLVEAKGNRSASYCFFKRTLDIVGSLALILALSPVLLITWVLLMLTTKGNPLFVQNRIGYLGRRFPMLKFRTMRLDAEKVKHLVENTHTEGPIFKNRKDPRITAIGGFLRRTSIDELPQLFNVLMGQMSLVGPRPALVKEVAAYEAWQRQRLAVQPGLTCLWQISGRSEIGFRDWCRMDIWYLNNQSILTDLWLLVKTPYSVLSGRGAY